MKKHFTLALFFFSGLFLHAQQPSLKLWYRQPANAAVPDGTKAHEDDPEWIKALPLGNGNIGAMVFGDVNTERIQLNEKTLWSGRNFDNDNPGAPEHLARIRQLLFEGRFKEATELTNQTQVCKGVGSGHGAGANVPFGCFQTLGDLWIDFGRQAAYSNYYRDLDLTKAIANVQYSQEGVRYQRQYFISAPANVLVVRLTADKKSSLSFTVRLSRPERFATHAGNGELIMQGAMDNGSGGRGMEYMVRLKAKLKGGTQRITDAGLAISDADEVLLYLTASTDYLPLYPVYKGRDYKQITQDNLDKAFARSFAQLQKEHLADYRRYFNRVSFQLNAEGEDLATDERLKQIKTSGNDNALSRLYFQYGRYLLIASSRENTLPANLQGIWANKIQTPWNGDYHTNINLQMNYWPAENTNLGDLHLPMIDFIRSLEKPATKSASVQFGLKGWCINPIVNVWGFTSPGEVPSWGLTPGASGWICQHLWEHYAFTKDEAYLRSVYPLLKNAARFYLGWLVTDSASGKLVSGPASSPENSFLTGKGERFALSMGPAHDQEIIDELFGNVLAAAQIVGDKDALVQEIKEAKDKLLRPAIGPDGRVQEWARPYEEPEKGHRHLSHLYALYPGYTFNSRQTPEYLAAAQRSLEYRLQHGGGHTGWSAAWVMNSWARLKNGNEALKAFNDILMHKSADNLFNLHPPFQIDGSLGATAGIAEMLLQSHEGVVAILPALPAAWPDGEVRGLCARGGFVVGMKWKEGKLVGGTLQAKKGGQVRLQYKDKTVLLQTKPGLTYSLPKQLLN